jgi:type VI secretion system protein ImpC
MEYEVSFGRLGNVKCPVPGTAFRLAVLGDFSGRANAGVLETGAALAARKPHKVDVDNLDTLLERLSVTVSVPIDEDRNVVSATIRSLDDFHPDQLVENLPVFEELLRLRRDLQSRAGFDRAAKEILSWSGAAALPPVAERQARGCVVATDRKLSTASDQAPARYPGRRGRTDPVSRRPLRSARATRQDALLARVDAALVDAMRRVLHTDFQSAEALWRGMEFLVRRVETDARRRSSCITSPPRAGCDLARPMR